MGIPGEKRVEYLVVDTTAFIQNAPLQDISANILTVPEVVNEITNKRQLRRLCVLPYELIVKEAFPENVQAVTDFTKKTGDYPSLSLTDIKVMALTYQLEKEHVGIEHLRTEPVVQKSLNVLFKKKQPDMNPDITGFYLPGHKPKSRTISSCESIEDEVLNVDITEELKAKFENLDCKESETLIDEECVEDILVSVKDDHEDSYESCTDEEDAEDDNEEDDEDSWITPSNVKAAKKQVNSELLDENPVKVACITTDFAMQNVLKQMNLNVSALDGRMIKQLRTFILRCYTCFATTSIMTKTFCPKCGNSTLKRVAVSLDKDGKQQIHINGRRPLTARGKKFSLPTMKGGKHSHNPTLAPDQRMPDQRSSRLARTKFNPMEDDYIAGYSPFVMRDVNSKSAQLGLRPSTEIKHWMRSNPNEAKRNRKK